MVSTRSMKNKSKGSRKAKQVNKVVKRSGRKAKKTNNRPVVFAVDSSDPSNPPYVVTHKHCNCPWFTWQCAPGRDRAGKKCKHQKLVQKYAGKKNAGKFGVYAY